MRFIIGIGGAFGFVGVLRIAEEWLPRDRFAFASGLLLALGSIGAIVEDNLLERVLRHHNLTTVFFCIGLFGFILSIVLFCFLRDKKDLKQSLEKVDVKTSGIKKSLTNPLIWVNGIIGFCIYFQTVPSQRLWGKSYLVSVSHFTTDQSVFAVTMIFLGWGIGAPVMGWLSDLTDRRILFVAIGSLAAAACISLIIFIPTLSFLLVCSLLTLFGMFSSTMY